MTQRDLKSRLYAAYLTQDANMMLALLYEHGLRKWARYWLLRKAKHPDITRQVVQELIDAATSKFATSVYTCFKRPIENELHLYNYWRIAARNAFCDADAARARRHDLVDHLDPKLLERDQTPDSDDNDPKQTPLRKRVYRAVGGSPEVRDQLSAGLDMAREIATDEERVAIDQKLSGETDEVVAGRIGLTRRTWCRRRKDLLNSLGQRLREDSSVDLEDLLAKYAGRPVRAYGEDQLLKGKKHSPRKK